MQEPIELDYNDHGYLILPEWVAQKYFPNDTVALLVKGDEVWILPTRGPASGGLLLKQRNASGDRSLLAAPYLLPETPRGSWPAFWDENAGALRVVFGMPPIPHNPLRLESAIAAKAVVEFERGRWVVYLDLGFSSEGSSAIHVERRKITDYSSPGQARVAAAWIERAADRDLRSQCSGADS